MPLARIELVVKEFLVVFLDVAHACLLEQLVAVIHFHAERAECRGDTAHVGDDSVFLVGQLGQIVLLDFGVQAEFNHFRVNHHKLEFVGAAAV